MRAKEEEKRAREEEKARKAEEERQRKEERRMMEEKLRAERERQQAENAIRMEQKKRETEYTLLGGSWDEDEEAEVSENSGARIQDLEQYRYFDGAGIKKYMKISAKTMKDGEQLCREGKISVKRVSSGFDRRSEDRIGDLEAKGV